MEGINGSATNKVESIIIISMLILVSISLLVDIDGFNEQQIESEILLGKTDASEFMDGDWISLDNGDSQETASRVFAKSGGTTGTVIRSEIYGMFIQNWTLNSTYSLLRIPEFGLTKEKGCPSVPLTTKFIEVPHDVDLTVSIVSEEYHIIKNITIAPAQELARDYSGYVQGPVSLNNNVYNQNETYPSMLTYIEGELNTKPIIIRGHRVVLLTLFPVRYNPVMREAIVSTNIEIKIEYSIPSRIAPIPGRLWFDAFEKQLEGIILNYNPLNKTMTSGFNSSVYTADDIEGAEYLILTTTEIYDETDNNQYSINDFIKWKREKGLITKVVTEVDYNPDDATSIISYLETAYTWTTPPKYVLIIGDTEIVATYYGMQADPLSHGSGRIATDVKYVTLDGPDLLQDLYIGRLSVDDSNEAKAVIKKIMQYERNPCLENNFYMKATAVSRFPDMNRWDDNQQKPYGDGVEDFPYISTSETVIGYLENHGIETDRIYSLFSTDALARIVLPSRYNNWYAGGGPVSAIISGYDWVSASDPHDQNSELIGVPIDDAINDGRFLVFHRDHAESRNWWNYEEDPPSYSDYNAEGWIYPNFFTNWHLTDYTSIADDPFLENENMYPILFSVDCMSGWFDGETDETDDSNLGGRSSESLCEEIVRVPDAGAVAAIGPSRTTYSGPNDDLLKGFMDAIWDDSVPYFSSSGGYYELGQIITQGKMYTIDQDFFGNHPQYDFPTATQETIQLYNLFGDPNMEIRTEVPENLNVAYPSMIGSTVLQSFIVRVTDGSGNPIQGASVCLYREADVFETDTTDSKGHVIFDIIPETGIGEPIKLTVTMHNYIPFQDDITVTDDGGGVTAVVSTDTPCIVSIEGELFGETGSESIQIFINTQDGSQLLAKGLSYVADGEFTYLWDTTGFEEEDIINIMIYGTYSERAAVTTLEMPLCYNPDPYLYCQYSPSTWHLNPGGENPTWDNPDIEIVGIDSMDFVGGIQYSVRATIHNDKSIPATDTHVHFYYHAFGIGVGSWNEFKENTITVPAGINNDAVTWATFIPPSSGQYCIVVSIHNDHDGNNGNNIGSENRYIEPVSSPNSLTIPVSNPTSEAGYTYIEVKQIGSSSLSVWDGYVEEFADSWIEPGESHFVTLTFDSLDDAQDGETREFVVTSFIRGELIGGVNIIAMKQVPPTPPPTPKLGLVAGALGGALVVILIIYMYYRRKGI